MAAEVIIRSIDMADVIIESTWKTALEQEFVSPYWHTLSSAIRTSYLTQTVYPPPSQVFRALNACPFPQVRVVILGQDPYHGKGQANGLCFSVAEGISLPPSLQNIFREIHNDIGVVPYPSGDLSRWATQGVLLLNSVLTVLAGKPASHAGLGWETFTDSVIEVLSEKREHIVYMLWGKYAQKKGAIIDRTRNLVLESAHPSPYSAPKFFGNRHFSQANTYLESYGQKPIDWR